MSKKNYTDLQRKFGENAQRIRLAQGLSLRAVAMNCDLDDSNISKIENGKSNVQLSTIMELAKGLGVAPEALVKF